MTNQTLIDQIVKYCNRDLREEERIAVEWWVKGRSLAPLMESDGFQVVMEILESYAATDERRLLNLPAGDPAVVAAHAAATTSRVNLARLKEDMAAAIDAAKDVPEVVKEAYRGMPPESV